MRFKDRIDAGGLLAQELRGRTWGRTVVLGIPRGGVIVAAEVAKGMGSELDVVVVRKIGHPIDPEYAVGAVDPDGGLSKGAVLGLPEGYLERERNAQLEEIARRLSTYRGHSEGPNLSGATVVIVDDGVATGLTAESAVVYARSRGAAYVVMAAPVMSPDAVRRLEAVADEVITLDAPPGFTSVGSFYRSFPQATDAEVIEALRGAANEG